MMLSPQIVQKAWQDQTQVKKYLIGFFQDYYKPKSSFEQEKVEYNQINILAEYQTYNLFFCKTKLLLDNHKTAVVLDIFWKLLEFNPLDKEES